MELDPKTQERIDEPVSEEAQRETRLTPAEATAQMRIRVPERANRKLRRQLTKHGIEPAMVTDYGMTRDDAEVVVALTALTHCIGMSIHRHGHEDFSLFLAEPKLRELLEGIYEEPDLTVVVSDVLQGIISHRADGEPLTLE